MNHIGTPSIILIYMMTTLPVFIDGKTPCLTDATINLFSTFKDRLNATSNFAKSEYNARTSKAIDTIYNLTGRMLYEQLNRTADSANGNYADKLANEADPTPARSPAVAFAAANIATDDVAKLINAQVVGSDVKQLVHRHVRKICKPGRSFCLHAQRTKKLYSETSISGGQSSRSTLENRRMRRPTLSSLSMSVGVGYGDDGGSELSSVSTDIEPRQSAIPLATIAALKLPKSSSSHDSNAADTAVFAPELNRRGLPSDKWRKKLQIDGRKKNFGNFRSRPYPLEEQSNELIESDKGMDESGNKRQRGRNRRTVMGDFEPRINTRSVDLFPEVLSGPVLVESSQLPAVGLNEDSRSVNVIPVPLSSMPSNITETNTAKNGHQTGNQIQPFNLSPIGTAINLETVHGDASNFTNMFEQLLGKLESLKQSNEAGNTQPEGSPCDIIGTWNSETIGLQFHISLMEPTFTSLPFVDGKNIEIELSERIPPRRHDLMDCGWYLMGTAVKQFGGPFYITAQKADRLTVATFGGLCKTCGGIPTIFGSWTFVYPAKDCQDISLSIDNKHDILRRDTLEFKRKHHFNKMKETGKCSRC